MALINERLLTMSMNEPPDMSWNVRERIIQVLIDIATGLREGNGLKNKRASLNALHVFLNLCHRGHNPAMIR